ncbi:MAG: hypothetical protein IPM82_30160 [Saprospiraceae bacterium]|nr:hypothetical protein [Saprospiraceae bacterium]
MSCSFRYNLDRRPRPLDTSTRPLGPVTIPLDTSTLPLDPANISLDISTRPLEPEAIPLDTSTRPLDRRPYPSVLHSTSRPGDYILRHFHLTPRYLDLI